MSTMTARELNARTMPDAGSTHDNVHQWGRDTWGNWWCPTCDLPYYLCTTRED